jgi:hypothetical protein
MAPRKKQEVELEVQEVQGELEGPELMEEVELIEEEFGENELMFDQDGNELLFPGGPTLAKIEEWKSLHGDVYFTEFDEDVYLWRSLRRKEYKDIMKINGADQYYKEERIVDKVMLYPENYNFISMTNGKAGVPTLLSELVMEKSGFSAKTGAVKL